jgi:hypothetical protein
MSGRGVCALCGWDDDSHLDNGAVKRLCETMAENDELRRELAALREFVLCDCRVKGKSTVSHTANCPANSANGGT